MSLLKSLIVVFLSAAIVRVISAHNCQGTIGDCQVFVDEPWPVPYVLVPRESTVEIYCTAGDNSYTPIWLIDLANDTKSFSLQFINQEEQLNAHSVYQLPRIEKPGMQPTLRLLINDTVRNNQTKIQCDRSQNSESTTTLLVLDPIILLVGDTVDFGINLSWSRQSQGLEDAALNVTLRVSDGTNIQEIPLFNESTYHFTAPKGAPPCEVYNFSVTATYVGATYIGAGCSVPSNVISTTLPSLPNVSRLESTLNYVLGKKSTGFSLDISFEPACYCEDYPVVNYTLVVNGSFNDEILISLSPAQRDKFTFIRNLSDNAYYTFRILVANTVGIVSTYERHFYTTDVQGVMATLFKGINPSIIQCEFITGSDATGCMVMLTSENSQETRYNLTRNWSTTSASLNVTLEYPPSCYTGVKALDIEFDGSVGSLPIPGQLIVHSQAPCTQQLPVEPGSSGSVLTVGIIVAIVIFILSVSAVIAIIFIVIKSKISQDIAVGVESSISNCPCVSHVHSSTDGMHNNCKKKPTQFELTDQMDNAIQDSSSVLDEQSSQVGDDSMSPEAAERGRETTCCGSSQSEVQETAANENIYSEIPSSSQFGGDGAAMHRKSENTYSEVRSMRDPSKGACVGRAGLLDEVAAGAGVPPEETLYEQPFAALERTPGDGADYSRTCHHNPLSPPPSGLPKCKDNQYSTLDQNKDHIYFTLEPERAPRGVTSPLSATSRPQTTGHEQAQPRSPNPNKSSPPVYQDITELSTSSTRTSITHEGICVSNTTLDSSSLPHIQRSHSVPIAECRSTEKPKQWVLNRNVSIGTMV